MGTNITQSVNPNSHKIIRGSKIDSMGNKMYASLSVTENNFQVYKAVEAVYFYPSLDVFSNREHDILVVSVKTIF